MRSDLRAAGTAVGALLAGLVVLALGLAASGYDAGNALAALVTGAFGSWSAFTGGTLVRAVPLILIGLGFALALRGGALNIGAEGQFYLGAIAATWVGVHAAGWPGWIALPALAAAGLLAGALWMVVPVVLRLRFGVLEVISTLLLNFVADALVSLMVLGPMQEPTGIYPQSAPIAASARLPLLPGTRLHGGFVVALLSAAGLSWVFARTWWGFRLLALGTGPRAAEVSGRVPAKRLLATALFGSAALAGLAGAFEVSGVSYALYQNLSPGYGFTAIGVALLARLRPSAIIVTGIIFGALEVGAGAMQRDAGIPAVAAYVVEAVIILALLLGDAASRRGSSQKPVVEAAEVLP
jgi:simple sugar transport system permease protein